MRLVQEFFGEIDAQRLLPGASVSSGQGSGQSRQDRRHDVEHNGEIPGIYSREKTPCCERRWFEHRRHEDIERAYFYLQPPQCLALAAVEPIDARAVPDDHATSLDQPDQQRATFATVDLRLGLQGPTWSVIGWVTNLANDRHLEEVIPAPEFGGAFISPAALRRWGVDVTFKF